MPRSVDGDRDAVNEASKNPVEERTTSLVHALTPPRSERDKLRGRMLDDGASVDQIAMEMALRWGFRPLRAWRHAHGLTQDEVAARYNEVRGERGRLMTGKVVSDLEVWPDGGRRPSIEDLAVFAEVYGADPGADPERLLFDASVGKSAQLDSGGLRLGPDEHDVSIYTTADNGTALQDAVLEILDVCGFEIEVWGTPERGSWFRRLRVRSVDGRAVEKLAELAGKLERAAELKFIDTPRSESDVREANAVAQLLQNTSSDQEVVILLSSVLFVRTGGTVVVKVLTEDEIRTFRDFPHLLKSPAEILNALTLLRQRPEDAEHDKTTSALSQKLGGRSQLTE
jgi:transcriptional regulator with XRE-family HTH domain